MSVWHPALIGLGSNLGDRLALIRAGAAGLAAHEAVRDLRASRIYQTPPWGGAALFEFLNAVVWLETTLPPRALLELCLAVEADNGRVRTVRWGPRTLDLDLLWYDDQTVDEPDLSVPHPRIGQREFVLRPLSELMPELRLPDGRTVAQTLAEGNEHACLPLPGAQLLG